MLSVITRRKKTSRYLMTEDVHKNFSLFYLLLFSMTQVLRKRCEFKIPGCSRSFTDCIIKLFWRDQYDVVLV